MTGPELPPSVFIVGCPRSGTSVFFKTLARHPAFATTTNLTRRFRNHFWMVTLAERLGARHRPVEAGALWRSFWPPGVREATGDDLTEAQRRTLQRIVTGHVRHFGRPVFLNKKPGNLLRVRWLAAGLPNARFIHCLRDGRAVANSILRECRKAGRRWSYLGREIWPELATMEWPAYAGALWSRLATTAHDALGTLDPARVHTVRYEEFVADPVGTLAATAAFCEVGWSDDLTSIVPRLQDRNERWREELTAEEQALMLEQARPGLEALGYAEGLAATTGDPAPG